MTPIHHCHHWITNWFLLTHIRTGAPPPTPSSAMKLNFDDEGTNRIWINEQGKNEIEKRVWNSDPLCLHRDVPFVAQFLTQFRSLLTFITCRPQPPPPPSWASAEPWFRLHLRSSWRGACWGAREEAAHVPGGRGRRLRGGGRLPALTRENGEEGEEKGDGKGWERGGRRHQLLGGAQEEEEKRSGMMTRSCSVVCAMRFCSFVCAMRFCGVVCAMRFCGVVCAMRSCSVCRAFTAPQFEIIKKEKNNERSELCWFDLFPKNKNRCSTSPPRLMLSVHFPYCFYCSSFSCLSCFFIIIVSK